MGKTFEVNSLEEMCDLMCGNIEPDNIQVIHKNGYSGILYGEKSMIIYDPNGKEVLHTGSRGINTEDELTDYLARFPEIRAQFISVLDAIDNDDGEDADV